MTNVNSLIILKKLALNKSFCVMTLMVFLTTPVTIAQNQNFEIFALQFAELSHQIPVRAAAVGSDSHDSTGVSYMIWLIRNSGGKTILVDAGFTDTTINPLVNYKRPDLVLQELNIKADEITDIIITHPHWDHIGGIDLFPKAMIWMQKKDFEYFVGAAWQKGGNKNGFNKKDVQIITTKNIEGKLTLIDGDDIEILPGIRVFTGAKHTFESQFVQVGKDDHKVILASDNSWFYYNLEHLLPIPVTHDSRAYLKNLKRMKGMVKNTDLIIPGHDPLVFTKFKKVNNRIVKIDH